MNDDQLGQIMCNALSSISDPMARLEVTRRLLIQLSDLELMFEDQALTFKQEPKYRFKGQIVNRQSGRPIPLDEPLFLLRGRDVTAVATLESYLAQVDLAGCLPEHLEAVKKRIEQFQKFAIENSERMKIPDTQLTDEWL